MLENEFIKLRPITIEDTDNILKWRNSSQVKKYFCMQSDLTRKEHEWWLENKVKSGKAIQFIINLKKEQKDIGTIYIRDIDSENKNGEFGIYIGESDLRGMGYGTMAMDLIVKYAFLEKKLHKVYLRVLSDNERAKECYKKNGFVEEGVFKEHVYKQGKGFVDVTFMGRINDND